MVLVMNIAHMREMAPWLIENKDKVGYEGLFNSNEDQFFLESEFCMTGFSYNDSTLELSDPHELISELIFNIHDFDFVNEFESNETIRNPEKLNYLQKMEGIEFDKNNCQYKITDENKLAWELIDMISTKKTILQTRIK